jgi:hypothetical protein
MQEKLKEIRVEEYLKKQIRKAGGSCYKWTSPGNAGVPDRIVMMPEGRIAFVETKATSKKPRPLQVVQMNILKNLGFRVEVLDSYDAVDRFVAEMCNG